MPETHKTITVRLPVDLTDFIQARAKVNDRNFTGEITHMLRRAKDELDKPKPMRKA